jgi:hypothetical protein
MVGLWCNLSLGGNMHWNRQSRVVEWWAGEVTLPPALAYHVNRPSDTDEGYFTSPDGKLIIEYDIGGYAGAWANPDRAESFEESFLQGARVWVAERRWPNGKGGWTILAAVTFPDSGCANLYIKGAMDKDVEIIRSIARSFQPKVITDGNYCR